MKLIALLLALASCQATEIGTSTTGTSTTSTPVVATQPAEPDELDWSSGADTVCEGSPELCDSHPDNVADADDLYLGDLLDAGDGLFVHPETGAIYQLGLETGLEDTGLCVHMSPCYDGTNGPELEPSNG